MVAEKAGVVFFFLMYVMVGMFAQITALTQIEVPVQSGDVIVTEAGLVVIHENVGLRSACAAGAIMGAVLSILIFPGTGTLRELSAKFLASLIGGILFTPVIMHWSGITLNLDYVIAVSGGLAFMFVTAIHKAKPIFEKSLGAWLERMIERIFGK